MRCIPSWSGASSHLFLWQPAAIPLSSPDTNRFHLHYECCRGVQRRTWLRGNVQYVSKLPQDDLRALGDSLCLRHLSDGRLLQGGDGVHGSSLQTGQASGCLPRGVYTSLQLRSSIGSRKTINRFIHSGLIHDVILLSAWFFYSTSVLLAQLYLGKRMNRMCLGKILPCKGAIW